MQNKSFDFKVLSKITYKNMHFALKSGPSSVVIFSIIFALKL